MPRGLWAQTFSPELVCPEIWAKHVFANCCYRETGEKCLTIHSKKPAFRSRSSSRQSYGASQRRRREQLRRLSREWVSLIRPKAEAFGDRVGSLSPVGYRAPCRCKKCKPVTVHPSGASGPVSTPKVPTGFEYQGLRFPHFLRRSNFLSENSSGTKRRP